MTRLSAEAGGAGRPALSSVPCKQQPRGRCRVAPGQWAGGDMKGLPCSACPPSGQAWGLGCRVPVLVKLWVCIGAKGLMVSQRSCVT